MIKKPLLFFFFMIPLLTAGQAVVRGKVINEKTKEPLPFVNIVIKGTYAGTTSDIDGRFRLSLPSVYTTLVFSYVGFQTQTINIADASKPLTIFLKEISTELQAVVIRSSDNPAFKIIRNVIKNKPHNDPENLPSFSYNAYNKLYSTLLNADSIEIKEADTAKFKKYLRDHHLFVHESYTQRKFLKPNFSKEVVLGNHLSGVKDPFFAFVATDLQPFSFYRDFILLFGKEYINPISKGSMDRYDFVLMDTVFHENDSVYVIHFEPLPGKVFEALKGELYISTDGYAIEHVIAEPADDKSLVETLIQQKYEKVNGQWFPVQLNSEFRFTRFDLQGFKLKYVSRSYFTHIKIPDDSLSTNDFGLINIEFSPQANHRDSTFWKEHRTGEFDNKDAQTFHSLDSLGEKLKVVQTAFKVFEGLFAGRFKAGSFYIPIEHVIQLNQYEALRLGIGLQTGEKISKLFNLEGYAGYGLGDNALKYGGALQLNISRKKDANFRFSFRQDLAEPGRPDYIKTAIASRTQESLRNWMTSRMDSIQQVKIAFNYRPFHFSQLSVFLQQEKRNPTYDYTYVPDGDKSSSNAFVTSAVGLQWRFAFKENYMKIGESKVVTSASYPQLNFYFSKSFSGLADGEYNFTKFEMRFDHQFLSRRFGKTTFQIDAGYLYGNTPYGYLFNARGSKYGNSFLNSIIALNTFQTMGLYEFFSNRYACIFLNHHVGRITGNKSRYFRPELSFIQNTGIGSLKNISAHQGVTFSSMEKGYFESGLIITNLLRINYLDLLYFGIGGGVFCRYGYYHLPDTADNLAVKFILSVGF